MTRFARAKGSKASNERKEEDPTPWHIMRQQLAEQLNQNDNCEKVSSFADITTNNDVCKPKEETWVEFNEFKLNKPNFTRDTKTKTVGDLPKLQNEKTSKKKTNAIKNDNIVNNVNLCKIKERKVKNTNAPKPLKTLFKLGKSEVNECKTKNAMSKGNIHSEAYKRNIKKQDQSNADNFTVQTIIKPTMVDEHEDVRFNNNINKTTKKINTERNGEELKTSKLEDTSLKQEHTRLTPLEPYNFETSLIHKNPKHLTQNISKVNSKEKLSLQIANSKKVVRKESSTSFLNQYSHSNVQTIIANGRKIDIVKFEAFWIKKDDASRLKELRKKLRDQKMTNDKIKTIIKLERRKAEKALSREKTNVCYHCRKFGHKFSECPEINNSSMSKSGICFKCGSTEHTHFECKVTQSQNYRYAVCFVCNEQGHIARQCSLNPQGQYPKGGSCHLCGEVTHLRKDCPKAFEDKPSSFATVEKINSVGLEDVSEMKTNNKKLSSVKNKVVLF